MKLFKKNWKNSPEKPSTLRARLSEIFDKRKRQLADFLGRQSEKLSPQSKKVMLLFFGVMMGGLCLALILKPFHRSAINSPFILEAITPTVIVPKSSMDSLLSHEDHEKLIGFMKVMDSLRKYDHATYDELLKGREGLLDSIRTLIRIY